MCILSSTRITTRMRVLSCFTETKNAKDCFPVKGGEHTNLTETKPPSIKLC